MSDGVYPNVDWRTIPGQVPVCEGCYYDGQRCKLGLQNEVIEADGSLTATMYCPPELSHGNDVASGVWVASMFAEILGHIPIHRGTVCALGTIESKFLGAVTVDRTYTGRVAVDRIEGRKWFVSGRITSADGRDIASATAILIEPPQAAGH